MAAARERARSRLREGLEALAFAVAVTLALKVFALEVYRIPTPSMEPTLLGTPLRAADGGAAGAIHDRVLVDKAVYLLREPARWEVAVFRYPLATVHTYVKRIAGLPGEEIRIRHGDLVARPAGTTVPFRTLRKPAALQEALWRWVAPEPGRGPWEGWTLEGTETAADGGLRLGPGSRAARGGLVDDPRHGWPEALGHRVPPVPGRKPETVRDLRLAVELRPEPGAGPLLLRLQAGSPALSLRLEAGRQVLELPGGERLEAALDLGGGAWEVDLAHWDATARLRLGPPGGPPLWDTGARELPEAPLAAGSNGVSLEAPAGGWSLRRPRLWRDLHYRPPAGGAEVSWTVPEGHYFFLGDYPEVSLDSRDWERRVLELDPAPGRPRRLEGDHAPRARSLDLRNPRESRDGRWLAFRDLHGELWTLPAAAVRGERSEAAPFVPRHYILGKVQAVFLPVPPLAPVARFGFVR